MVAPVNEHITQEEIVKSSPHKETCCSKQAPESSVKVMSVALRILEGIGLVFANIVTLGLINFLPGIHDQYQKVFGGKKVEEIDPETSTTDHSQQEVDNKEVHEPPKSSDSHVEDGHAIEVTGTEDLGAKTDEDLDSLPVVIDESGWVIVETGKNVIKSVQETCTKENAKKCWDGTQEYISYGASKAQEGIQYGWEQLNRENLDTAYRYATNPQNIKKHAAKIGAVAVGALSIGIYALSGGDTSEVIDLALNATTTG